MSVSVRRWPLLDSILAQPTIEEQRGLIRFALSNPAVRLISCYPGVNGPVNLSLDDLFNPRSPAPQPVMQSCLLWNTVCPNPLCYFTPRVRAGGERVLASFLQGALLDPSLSPVIDITLTNPLCDYGSVASHLTYFSYDATAGSFFLWDAAQSRWITHRRDVEARLQASFASLGRFAVWQQMIFDWVNRHWGHIIPDD